MVADLERILLQFLTFQNFEHGLALGANDWVAAEGVEVNSLGEDAGNLWSCDHCGQRTAGADALGHGYDVGHHTLKLEAPEMLASPGEPSLDFVGDANPAGSARI